MRLRSLALAGVIPGILLSTSLPADAGCMDQARHDVSCGNAGVDHSDHHAWRRYQEIRQPVIQTLGSTLGIGTSDQSTVAVIRTPVTGQAGVTGRAWGTAAATLTGPGQVATGAYTETRNQANAHSLYLGGQTTVNARAVSDVSSVNWAQAVSTGTGQANVTASGQSLSDATARSGSSMAASAAAAAGGTAAASLSGPGTVKATNISWTRAVTQTNAVYQGSNLLHGSASATGSAGSTSFATSQPIASGSAAIQVTAASTARTATLGGTGASSALAIGAMSGGADTVRTVAGTAAQTQAHSAMTALATGSGH